QCGKELDAPRLRKGRVARASVVRTATEDRLGCWGMKRGHKNEALRVSASVYPLERCRQNSRDVRPSNRANAILLPYGSHKHRFSGPIPTACFPSNCGRATAVAG